MIAAATVVLSGLILLGLIGAAFLFTLIFSRVVEALYPPVGARVEVSGGRLHIVETPAIGAFRATALLVHGGSGNFADPHVALAEPLARAGFRVLSADRPGHGWSDRVGGRDAASPRAQAAALRAAAEALGVAHAVVVVHSLAGVTGLAMALDAPEFTRGLVLLAPVSHPWPGGVSWYYTAAVRPLLGALFRWLVVAPVGLFLMRDGLREVFAPDPPPADYARRTRLALLFRPWQFLANAEDFVALHAATEALSPRYRDIVSPTVVVMGERDGLVSADIHARRLAREIPGARLRMLEGVGHSPHFSAPDAVVAAVCEADEMAARETGKALRSA